MQQDDAIKHFNFKKSIVGKCDEYINSVSICVMHSFEERSLHTHEIVSSTTCTRKRLSFIFSRKLRPVISLIYAQIKIIKKVGNLTGKIYQ